MTYQPTEWINGETALSADNLNHMEQGILTNSEALGDLGIEELVERVNNLAAEAAALQTQLSLLNDKFPVGTGNIADSAITAAKIASAAIVQGKIASNAVTTGTIMDGNVTTAKIGNNQVTMGKLEVPVQRGVFQRISMGKGQPWTIPTGFPDDYVLFFRHSADTTLNGIIVGNITKAYGITLCGCEAITVTHNASARTITYSTNKSGTPYVCYCGF